MKMKKVYPLFGSMGVASIVALTLVFGVVSGASGAGTDWKEKASDSSPGIESGAVPQGATSKGEVEAAPAQVPGTPSSGAGTGAKGTPSEDIKVHGDWAIEVRDPDGSVVTRREFNNALELSGAQLLIRMFARINTFGLWQVQIGGDAGTPQPCSNNACLIVEPTDPDANANTWTFNNLSVQPFQVGAPTQALILTGNFVAQQDAVLTVVQTLSKSCDATVSPQQCAQTGQAAGFVTLPVTRAQIPSPPTVLTGQQVLVKVTLSFSG